MKIAHFVLIGLQTWPPHAMVKSKRMTDDGHQVIGKSSYCLWQGLLKRILKCEYLLVMYRINMLHYISISYLSFNRGEDFLASMEGPL
jgi:hypothetical protein